MPTTRKDHMKIYQHILKDIWDEDEKSPLHLALQFGTIFKSVQDLVNLPDFDIDRMMYEIDEERDISHLNDAEGESFTAGGFIANVTNYVNNQYILQK